MLSLKILSTQIFKKMNSIPYIDFDNLDETFYRKVFYPNFRKIDEETGYENKIGGSIPFFIEDEEWPISEYNGMPLTFIGQFTDPRENNKFLYRIFVPIDDLEECMFNSVVTKIELNEENLSKKIIIKNGIFPFPAYQIVSWEETKELYQLDYILKYYSVEYNDIFFENYNNSTYSPSWGIKIGGTSIFSQSTSDISKFNNFFQMAFCDQLPFDWGDSGIAHIYQNNDLLWLEFDCS